MAFRSRKRAPEAGDDFIDDGVQSKKTRTANNANFDSRGTGCKVDSNGDRYWEISKMRRVTVSTFRGKTMVNIREYYEKDGQELPGKKGISMPMDQYAAFVSLLPDIEVALKESGQEVPRPNYTDTGPAEEDNENDQSQPNNNSEGSASPKKNIEATSDEDEEEV